MPRASAGQERLGRTGNRLPSIHGTLAGSLHVRHMTPAAQQRLIDLPDAVRAWAREDPTARLYLSAHVTAGVSLGHALARLADALGEGGDWEVRLRQEAGVRREKFHPWCARVLPDGLRCRALTTALVQLLLDGAPAGAVECCDDCARAHERERTGRLLRRLAPR